LPEKTDNKSLLLFYLGLSFMVLGLYLFTTKGVRIGDNLIHADIAIGIVERGELSLSFGSTKPVYCKLTAIGKDGRFYSSLWPGLSFVSLPFIAVGSTIASVTRTTMDLPGLSQTMFVEGVKRYDLVRRFRRINSDPRVSAFNLISPLVGALTVFLFLIIAVGFGIGPRAAAGAAIGLSIASPLFTYSGTCWTQPLAMVCLFGAFLALVRYFHRPRVSLLFLCGLGLSVACLTRIDQFPLCLPFFVATLVRAVKQNNWKTGIRQAAFLGLPLFVTLMVVFLWNWIRFEQLLGPACAFQTGGWSLSHFPSAFFGQWFSLDEGLLFYAPLLLLVPFGIRPLAGKVGLLAAVALSIFILQWIMYSFWWDWNSKMCYGPRLLVQSMPFLFLFVAASFESMSNRGRVIFWVLIALGLAMQMPGVLLTPQKLPHTFNDEVWTNISWFVGWMVLLKGAYAVPGSSWMGDVVECLSGQSAFFLFLSIAVLCIGLVLLAAARRLARRESQEGDAHSDD